MGVSILRELDGTRQSSCLTNPSQRYFTLKCLLFGTSPRRTERSQPVEFTNYQFTRSFPEQVPSPQQVTPPTSSTLLRSQPRKTQKTGLEVESQHSWLLDIEPSV